MECNVSQCDVREEVIRQTISSQLYIKYLKVRLLGRNTPLFGKRMYLCLFLTVIYPATSSAAGLSPEILLGHSFQPATEKRNPNNPEAQWEIYKVRSSSPFKLVNIRTEATDEHKGAHKWVLHELFQIWKQLYWYLCFIQSILVPLELGSERVYCINRLSAIKCSCHQSSVASCCNRCCQVQWQYWKINYATQRNGNLESLDFIQVLLMFLACSLCSYCTRYSDLNCNHVTFFRPMQYSYSLSQ